MTDEMGENYIALYAEGLNACAYEEWLAIDEEAFSKKLQLSKNPESRGDIRAVTFMFTEKMQTNAKKRI